MAEARENIDYIINYYALLGVDQTAEVSEITAAYHQRQREWHTDRLEGLAPKIRAEGERMARHLNAARIILRDQEKRKAYDKILDEWTGPVSTDGTPIITAAVALRESVKGKTPAEIEAAIVKAATDMEGLLGYAPSRLIFLERMLEQAGDNVPADLQNEYEAALLQYDRALAGQELDRSILLGVPDAAESNQRATSDYRAQLTASIEATRTKTLEDQRFRALGGVSIQMAALEGRAVEVTDLVVSDEDYRLPAYFGEQADHLLALAGKREEVVKKRLANYEPLYPEEQLQPEALPYAAIGFRKSEASMHWSGIEYLPETQSIDWRTIPDEVKTLLDTGHYAEVIANGFNVVIIEPLDQIDLKEQLFNGIQKYAAKYGLGQEE